MDKHVLVINASPRAEGNTEALCDALIAGAKKAGHRTAKINVRTMDIKPCLGCYQCLAGKGTPCIQKDDMKEIYTALDQADTVVFASPLYWWQVNAQMKTVIDRLFAVAAANNMQMPQKEAALLIAAEDAREENFAQIVPYYQTCLVKNLNWIDRGMVLAGGVNMPGDVQKTPYLKQAEDLGASL
ncbi:flavodoxin family protein [Breznakiella homolactica]|uniref:Flavodoxin family protein n=1 Tax=Breznakiella homolactica TaxID=2798577 RepID=A0A7T8B9D8_9SPIR|nr:flavodoxin family protein [Breznakiella homolactica]QQO07850.1 flavodoxin family protein [Breznakiella homolactica]